MQYLSEWRLQLAAELLQTTRLGVAAVAYRVGYESEAAFNRAFKRAMGKPPAQWRAFGGLTVGDESGGRTAYGYPARRGQSAPSADGSSIVTRVTVS
jgi:AraC-like DNA-binding protein